MSDQINSSDAPHEATREPEGDNVVVYNDAKMKELACLVRRFHKDLTDVYPEYANEEAMDARLVRLHAEGSKTESKTATEAEAAVYMYCLSVYPPRFMDILYKNAKIFDDAAEGQSDNAVDVQLLPGVDFRGVWRLGVTEETEASIWKYAQLILFCLIESRSDKSLFEDSSHMFDTLTKSDASDATESSSSVLGQLETVVKEIGDYFQAAECAEAEGPKGAEGEAPDPFSEMRHFFERRSSGDAEGAGPLPPAPEGDAMRDSLDKMFGGKIGCLAKEIAQEVFEGMEPKEGKGDKGDGAEAEKGGDGSASASGNVHPLAEMFGLNDDGAGVDPADVMQNCMKNPAKLMGLVQNISSKLDSKIKSGELKESELLHEATSLIGCMKDMPGMPNMADMFSQMSNSKRKGKAHGRGRARAGHGVGEPTETSTSTSTSTSGRGASSVKERLQRKLHDKMQLKDTETHDIIEQNKQQLLDMQKRLQ